jgi:aspartate aminotransferase
VIVMKLATRLNKVSLSATGGFASRAKALEAMGRSIVNLAHGETSFATPPYVCAAAIEAIQLGKTRYTPAGGDPELRAAIARKYTLCGSVVTLADVIVSPGAKQVLFGALQVTLDPGDEVLLAAPCWVSYPAMVRLAGGTPIFLRGDNNHKLHPQTLDAAIRPSTRWLILNSPSNPAGVVYSASELNALAAVLASHPHVGVISDEIYEGLVYEGHATTLLNAAPNLRDRMLIVSGLSKTYAMTGWRVGYGVGPPGLISAMEVLQSHSTSNTCSISQAAALAALEGSQDFVAECRTLLVKARDRVLAGLAQAPKLHCVSPGGAFYAFPRWDALIGGSSPAGRLLYSDGDFCEALLEEAGVAVVPGEAFGGPGHFRLTFAANDAVLEKGLARIRSFVTAVTPTVPTGDNYG